MQTQEPQKNERPNHPLAEANFFSRIFFFYTFGQLKNSFDPKRLYEPLISDKSELLGDRLERSWNRQLKTTGRKKKSMIFKSILGAFGCNLLSMSLFSFLEVLLRIAEPICLGHVLAYFQPYSTITKDEVLFWTIAMLVANGLRVIAYAQQRYHTLHTAMKIRVACSNLIYRKVLRMRSTTLQEDGGGKINTLISNDLSRFDLRTELINYVYTAPFVVIVVIYVMYQQFGIPGLVGVGFIFVISFVQAFLAHYSSKYHILTTILTDERMRLMHSFLNGIQVIKMYAWENSFAKLIDKARTKELNIMGKSFMVKAISESVYTFIVPISIYLALYVVIADKDQITVVMVFLMVIYYTLLNYMITIFFTLGLAKLFEICIVLNRVNDFLLSEERQIDIDYTDTDIKISPEEVEQVYIEMNDVHATWLESSDKKLEFRYSSDEITTEKTALLKTHKKDLFEAAISSTKERKAFCKQTGSISLRRINLKVEADEFVGILGSIGSGKSSLLQVILGEMLISSGSKRIQGKISYASQIPWTFTATVRQNILFGLDFNEERYSEVIRVCGLEKDLQQLPEGDATIIGDRGSSLSGGQKARINLARAVYREADIYLLDDPLSAVDVRVAKHISHECFLGFLKDKCRILVTHHANYLRNTDNIICMNNGTIEKEGKFQDIIQADMIENDPDMIEDVILPPTEDFSLLKRRSTEIEDSMSSSLSCDYSENINPTKDSESSTIGTKKGLVVDSKKNKTLLFKYLLSGSSCCKVTLTFLLFIFNQILISGASYYLGIWSSTEELRDRFPFLNNIILRKVFGLHKKGYYEGWYGFLIFIMIHIGVISAVVYAKLVKSNSRKIHDVLLENITKTSLRFFDTTSSGRILNRFSRDLGIIDEVLPRGIMEATQIMLMAIGSFLLLIIVDWSFLIPTVVLNMLFIGLLVIFSKLTKQLKRVESKLIGPILTHVNNSALGITTIKALSAEDIVTKEFETHQDNYSSSWFLYGTSSIALSFYVDVSCFLFLLYIALILVLYAKTLNISGGFVGMALTQAMSLTGVIQFGIRQCLEANNQLVAVERISHYENLEKEEEATLTIEPPTNWPNEGEILFENVGLRYGPSSPLVLRNLNICINPREKIGIVGRTGAGKSSIMAAIFRLCSVEGTIEIDGFDTRDIPLKLLRTKIAVIPQDPILFSGSLRFNLDPFDEYDDSTLYRALRAVEMKDSLGELCTLDYPVMSRGSNFSTGQRQLICLARALIRNNKILLLDEATANVDPMTDELIQKTIRKEFANCTVLTVAHRLNTVMDADRVIFMESGRIIEFDHPHVLLQNTSGNFYTMVSETGSSEAEKLKKTAFESYLKWKR